MSDEEKAASVSQDETAGPGVFTTDQQAVVDGLIDAAVKRAVGEVREDVRREMRGLNSKNEDLRGQIKSRDADIFKLKSEKMSGEERLQAELDRQKAEIDSERKGLIRARNRAAAESFAAKNSLPLDLVDLVPMDDEAQMTAALEKVKSVFEADRAALREAQKKEGGTRPSSAASEGKAPMKKKSDMTAGEAQIFVAEHGLEAYRALPA